LAQRLRRQRLDLGAASAPVLLHHFLPSQPTLNLHCEEVVEALLSIARFWLDRGADGFRLDAVDFLTHDPALRSNPAAAPWGGVVPPKLFALQDHRHDMIQPDTLPVLRRLRALLDEYPGAVALGEVSSQDGAYERIAGYTAGDGLLHMAYTLRPLRHGFDHPTVAALLGDAIATCAQGGWPCFSFSNHDVERAASRWAPKGPDGAGVPDPRLTRLLLALLLTLPGSACLYQGEELGLPDAVLREEEIRDPFGIAYWPEFKGRDGSRTPMPWRAWGHQAGFTAGTPWLPVPEAHRPLAVDAQEAAGPGSALGACRALLRLRREEPALRAGAAAPLALDAPLLGFVRRDPGLAGGRDVTLVFNLSDAPAPLPAAVAGAWRRWRRARAPGRAARCCPPGASRRWPRRRRRAARWRSRRWRSSAAPALPPRGGGGPFAYRLAVRRRAARVRRSSASSAASAAPRAASMAAAALAGGRPLPSARRPPGSGAVPSGVNWPRMRGCPAASPPPSGRSSTESPARATPPTGSASRRISSPSRIMSARRRDPGGTTAAKSPLAESQRRSASSASSAGGAVHSLQNPTSTAPFGPRVRSPRWSSPGAAVTRRSSRTGACRGGGSRRGRSGASAKRCTSW
jgi:glycosidase